ncbi:hypothetical protein JCM14469_19950 [Desulfatiferula olefinivorans]
MDSRELKTLQILEEIEGNGQVSQRSLADKLGMSLGLVNGFVRHLTAKGYFKAKSLPRKRVRYILTPEGAAEKTRLAYDYIRHSYDLYKRSYAGIHTLINTLVDQGVRRVVFFGAAGIAEMIVQDLTRTPIELVGVIDHARLGQTRFGHTVTGPDGFSSMAFDRVIVTAFDNEHYSLETLHNAGVDRRLIVTLDGHVRNQMSDGFGKRSRSRLANPEE